MKLPFCFQLFMTEFLNNPSLHERLAENINRTLSQRTDEKRSRKKSGKTTKGVTSDKSDKLEITSIHEEAESNCNQSLDSQGLTAFLDDILNLNVRGCFLVPAKYSNT